MAPRTYSALANWDGSLSPPKPRRIPPILTQHSPQSAIRTDRHDEEGAGRLSMQSGSPYQHGFTVPSSSDVQVTSDPSVDPLAASDRLPFKTDGQETRRKGSITSYFHNVLFSNEKQTSVEHEELSQLLSTPSPHARRKFVLSPSILQSDIQRHLAEARSHNSPSGPCVHEVEMFGFAQTSSPSAEAYIELSDVGSPTKDFATEDYGPAGGQSQEWIGGGSKASPIELIDLAQCVSTEVEQVRDTDQLAIAYGQAAVQDEKAHLFVQDPSTQSSGSLSISLLESPGAHVSQDTSAITTEDPVANPSIKASQWRDPHIIQSDPYSLRGSSVPELGSSQLESSKMDHQDSLDVLSILNSGLDREMSVVPETPDSSPAPSPRVTPEREITLSSGAPRHQGYECAWSVSSPVRDSSAGEGSNTLVGSIATKASQRTQSIQRAYMPPRLAYEIVPESPLTSISSDSEPLQQSVRQPRERLTVPRHRMYVAVPPPPAGRKREEYVPLEVVVERSRSASFSIPAPVSSPALPSVPPQTPTASQTPLTLLQASQPALKRKRTRSPESASSTPPRKKLAQSSALLSIPRPQRRSVSPMTLECLGDDAFDPLKPYSEYFPVDVEVFCENSVISDRIPDVVVLGEVLSTALRHLKLQGLETATVENHKAAESSPFPDSTESHASGSGEGTAAPTVYNQPWMFIPSKPAGGKADPNRLETRRSETLQAHSPCFSALSQANQGLSELQGYGSSPSLTPSPKVGRLAELPPPAPVHASVSTATPSPTRRSVQTTGAQTQDLPPTPYGHMFHSSPSGPSIVHVNSIELHPEKVLAFSQSPNHTTVLDHGSQSGFNPMRGFNAFFGSDVSRDPLLCMEPRMYDEPLLPSPMPEHEQDMSSPWMQEPYGLQGCLGMKQMAGTVLDDNIGTIDPSLLGGLQVPHSPSPPPPPTPVARPDTSKSTPMEKELDSPCRPCISSSEDSPSKTDDPRSSPGITSFSDAAHFKHNHALAPPQRPDEGAGKGEGEGKGKERMQTADENVAQGKSKGKGKWERALSKHEFFAHAPDVNAVASALSAEHIISGKRPHKLSGRVRESLASATTSTSTLVPRDGGLGSRTRDGARGASISTAPKRKIAKASVKDSRELAVMKSFCHQCRSTNAYMKMTCTHVKDDGTSCTLRYCQRCLVVRYPDIEFDPSISVFICPKCSGVCNCTHCCAHRGETYVSTRYVRIKIPKPQPLGHSVSLTPSPLGSLTRAKKNTGKMKTKTAQKSAPPEDVPLAPSMMLPQGALWGTVYGVNGRERMGIAVVLDDKNQHIALRSSAVPTVGTPKPRPRKFIGKPLAHWTRAVDAPAPGVVLSSAIEPDVSKDETASEVVRAYIGSKQPMYEWHNAQCFDGPLTPATSDGDHEQNDRSPSPSVRSEDLPFILAKLFTAANDIPS